MMNHSPDIRTQPLLTDRHPLVDAFGRVHTDLRVSVTDRCNIRCRYCMPIDVTCVTLIKSVISKWLNLCKNIVCHIFFYSIFYCSRDEFFFLFF